jgi:hypothetical protein
MSGYSLLEPDIYTKLNWDLDLIVKCLELTRIQMPQIIPQGAAGIEYDLIAVGNHHGSPYPAIGMHWPKETDWNTVPDCQQVDDFVDQWVEQIGLDGLIEKAVNVKYIDWEKLMNRRTFPDRED